MLGVGYARARETKKSEKEKERKCGSCRNFNDIERRGLAHLATDWAHNEDLMSKLIAPMFVLIGSKIFVGRRV